MEQTAPQEKPDNGSNTKLMAVLAYLGILVVIPFVTSKNDPFVAFHIRQGLVLVIIEIAAWVLGMYSWHLWPLIQLVNLGTLVLAIIGIVNVINHKQEDLPLVGSFAQKINI